LLKPTKTAFDKGQDLELETRRGRIAGLRWRPRPAADPNAKSGHATPVLAVHGWLDNAASYLPLAQHTAGLDLVAIDLPGHGQSSHHHPSAPYHFTDYVSDVDAALDALGWDSCHLLGHSMGSAILSLFAVAAPDRVRSLTCLDTLGPITDAADAIPGRLRRSLKSLRAEPRRKKPYASVDEMIAARLDKSDLDAAAARLICERSAQAVDSHFEWTNDSALYWVSPLVMTEDQALECMAVIDAPVLSITARPLASFIREETVQARIAALKNGTQEWVDGSHHFHMDHPQRTAARIIPFIQHEESRWQANFHSKE